MSFTKLYCYFGKNNFALTKVSHLKSIFASNANINQRSFKVAVTYRKCKSALYRMTTDSPKDKLTFTFRQPDINLDEIVANLDIVETNLRLRSMDLDLRQLKSDFIKVNLLENEIKSLMLKRNELSKEATNLVNQFKLNKNANKDDLLKGFKEQVKNIKLEIEKIKKDLLPIKDTVYLTALKLPNKLHSNISINEDKILFEYKSKNFRSNEIEHMLKKVNSDNNSKWSFIWNANTNGDKIDKFMNYTCGQYAKLEFELTSYFIKNIKQFEANNSIEYVKSVSLFKSAVIEGCGIDFNDSSKVLSILKHSNNENEVDQNNKSNETDLNEFMFHFTGYSSIFSLLLGFLNTKISNSNLPWLVYTNGNNQTPSKGQLNQFDLLAFCSSKSSYLINTSDELNNFDIGNVECKFEEKLKTDVKDFLSSSSSMKINNLFKSNNIDDLFIDLVLLIVNLYKDFNIDFRIVSKTIKSLDAYESYKIAFEMFMIKEKCYKEVNLYVEKKKFTF